MATTSSLDTNQRIYIKESSREELFKHILNRELEGDSIDYYFTSSNLERYCSGDVYAYDYAYSHISRLIKKEYDEWRRQYKEEFTVKDIITVLKDEMFIKGLQRRFDCADISIEKKGKDNIIFKSSFIEQIEVYEITFYDVTYSLKKADIIKEIITNIYKALNDRLVNFNTKLGESKIKYLTEKYCVKVNE